MSKKVTAAEAKTHPERPTLIRWRFYLLLVFVFGAFAALAGRIAYIQIIEPDNLIKQGDMRSIRAKTLCFSGLSGLSGSSGLDFKRSGPQASPTS